MESILNALTPALFNTSAASVTSSLSDWFTQQSLSITVSNILLSLVLGMLMGLLIAFVYKRCYRGVLYSPSFAMTLVMLTLITTPVVMAIKSNISLSMGMVGALSIVRFRTAVKDPMDTAYMYWALTMGILLGAELYVAAVAVALGIAVMIFIMSLVKHKGPDAYLLVLHYDMTRTGGDIDAEVMQKLRRLTRGQRLRSKTVTRQSVEMTVEVRTGDTQGLVSEMLSLTGMDDATLVSCQSEAGL